MIVFKLDLLHADHSTSKKRENHAPGCVKTTLCVGASPALDWRYDDFAYSSIWEQEITHAPPLVARRSFNRKVRPIWKLRWAPWEPFQTKSSAPRRTESVQLVDGLGVSCGASAVTGVRSEGEGRGVEAVAFHCVDLNVEVKVSASLSCENVDRLTGGRLRGLVRPQSIEWNVWN